MLPPIFRLFYCQLLGALLDPFNLIEVTVYLNEISLDYYNFFVPILQGGWVLSKVKFWVRCHLETVAEAATKLVLHNMHLDHVDVSSIQIIVGRSRSFLKVTQLFMSCLHLKNYLTNTYTICHAYSLYLRCVSGTKLGDLRNDQGNVFCFPFLKIYHFSQCSPVFHYIIWLFLTGSSSLPDAVFMKFVFLCQKVKVILSFKH